MKHHICLLRGSGMPMRHMAGPDKITLASCKKVHWVMLDECKLRLVHRWQAAPHSRTGGKTGSLFPCCMCLQALAVQCPEAGRVVLSIKWRPNPSSCYLAPDFRSRAVEYMNNSAIILRHTCTRPKDQCHDYNVGPYAGRAQAS